MDQKAFFRQKQNGSAPVQPLKATLRTKTRSGLHKAESRQPVKKPEVEVQPTASQVGTCTEMHVDHIRQNVKLTHDTVCFPNISHAISVGGRLRLFNDDWQKITSDAFILQAVCGYKLEFENGPPPIQTRVPAPYRLNQDERNAVDAEGAETFEQRCY